MQPVESAELSRISQAAQNSHKPSAARQNHLHTLHAQGAS